LYFASAAHDVLELQAEFASRREAGLPVEYLTAGQLASLTSIAAPAAMLSSEDGQLDPYAFTRGILSRAVASGLGCFGNSRLLCVESSGGLLRLKFPEAVVTAQRIVYATGYEAHEHFPDLPANLNSTYALASAPLASRSGWPEGCLLWETARPYFYARQTDDGRALIGGGDTEFHTDHEMAGLLAEKARELARRFGELFPAIPLTPEYVWGGVFAESKDGLAYIGAPPRRDNVYFALGYGGNGITFSAIAARLITDLYLRRPNPDAEVFSFER
jgi:glycine/D-amino acid oxidase-like deaminating enzyme